MNKEIGYIKLLQTSQGNSTAYLILCQHFAVSWFPLNTGAAKKKGGRERFRA